jgi:hypothetical protein
LALGELLAVRGGARLVVVCVYLCRPLVSDVGMGRTLARQPPSGRLYARPQGYRFSSPGGDRARRAEGEQVELVCHGSHLSAGIRETALALPLIAVPLTELEPLTAPDRSMSATRPNVLTDRARATEGDSA